MAIHISFSYLNKRAQSSISLKTKEIFCIKIGLSTQGIVCPPILFLLTNISNMAAVYLFHKSIWLPWRHANHFSIQTQSNVAAITLFLNPIWLPWRHLNNFCIPIPSKWWPILRIGIPIWPPSYHVRCFYMLLYSIWRHIHIFTYKLQLHHGGRFFVLENQYGRYHVTCVVFVDQCIQYCRYSFVSQWLLWRHIHNFPILIQFHFWWSILCVTKPIWPPPLCPQLRTEYILHDNIANMAANRFDESMKNFTGNTLLSCCVQLCREITSKTPQGSWTLFLILV